MTVKLVKSLVLSFISIKHHRDPVYFAYFNIIMLFSALFDPVGGTKRWDSQCSFDFYSNKNTKTGSFFSPGYPQNYPTNSNCFYFFYGSHDERVLITLINVQLDGTVNR